MSPASRLPLAETVSELGDIYLIKPMIAAPDSFTRVDRDAITSALRAAREHDRLAEEARERARRLLAPPTATATVRAARSAPAVELAEALLAELLPRDGRSHPSKPIVEAMNARGVSTASVHRARVRLGIKPARTRAFHAETRWSWPPLISGSAR